MFPAESFEHIKKIKQAARSSLERNSYLPGHSAVSVINSLLRDGRGVPFRHGRQKSQSNVSKPFSPDPSCPRNYGNTNSKIKSFTSKRLIPNRVQMFRNSSRISHPESAGNPLHLFREDVPTGAIRCALVFSIGIRACLTLVWRWHKVAIQTEINPDE